MSLRIRLLAAFALLLLPLVGALGWGVRNEMLQQISAQYEHRIDGQILAIQQGLDEESAKIAARLEAFKSEIAQDNRLRLAVVDEIPEYRPYLLDYAGRAMRLMGFSSLQLQDADGRILSSGHFRNAYDSVEPWLPRTLGRAPGGYALYRARTPEGPLVVFARVDSVQVGDGTLYLVGGFSAQRRFLMGLSPDDEVAVSLLYPGGARSTDAGLIDLFAPSDSIGAHADYLVRELRVPFAEPREDGSGRLVEARMMVTHHLGPLDRLRHRLQLWIVGALIMTVAVGLGMAFWLSYRLSRPLHQLAAQTESIDLDRLDIRFPVGRRDEVGVVARFLASMTQSLRASVRRLRDAERRATLGEVARQVNHDVKNGLIPIRNVLRHLSEVARDDPESLPRIYRERQSTLDSSLNYLERLAKNYARLSPEVQVQDCDINSIVSQVASAVAGGEVELETDLDPGAPAVSADPISLRRMVENLLQNAMESVSPPRGRVVLRTARRPEDSMVRVTVEDNGPGIPPEELRRVFDDFYSTRKGGVGLGLSIVRRLAADNNGSVHAESRVGSGSRFHVDLPAAGRQGESP